MNLHEVERVDDPENLKAPITWRMRVPGGWLYMVGDPTQVAPSTTFVPDPRDSGLLFPVAR